MRPYSHKNRVFWLCYAFVKRPLIGRIKWWIKRVVQDVERKNEGSGGQENSRPNEPCLIEKSKILSHRDVFFPALRRRKRSEGTFKANNAKEFVSIHFQEIYGYYQQLLYVHLLTSVNFPSGDMRILIVRSLPPLLKVAAEITSSKPVAVHHASITHEILRVTLYPYYPLSPFSYFSEKKPKNPGFSCGRNKRPIGDVGRERDPSP